MKKESNLHEDHIFKLAKKHLGCYDTPHMKSILPYIQIIISVILVALILLQRTGAQVGGAFGGSDNLSSAYHTRRGVEKGLFIATIILAIIFAVSALINLLNL